MSSSIDLPKQTYIETTAFTRYFEIYTDIRRNLGSKIILNTFLDSESLVSPTYRSQATWASSTHLACIYTHDLSVNDSREVTFNISFKGSTTSGKFLIRFSWLFQIFVKVLSIFVDLSKTLWSKNKLQLQCHFHKKYWLKSVASARGLGPFWSNFSLMLTSVKSQGQTQ